MLKFELILTFIFFIQKILNKECVIKNCESCQLIQEDKNGLMQCRCETCFGKKFNNLCTSTDCYYCLNNPEKTSHNDCLCLFCDDTKNPLDNGIKDEDNESSFPYFIIPIIIFIILFIPLLYCCFKRKKNNQNREAPRINRHINNIRNIRFVMDNNVLNSDNRALRVEITQNNINSNYNVITVKKKEIKLEEILSDEKYLGPKICKKEFEKFNILCTICFEKFKEGIDMVSLTPCSHLFHNKCLNDYFRKNKNAKCPNCNFDIIKHYQTNN